MELKERYQRFLAIIAGGITSSILMFVFVFAFIAAPLSWLLPRIVEDMAIGLVWLVGTIAGGAKIATLIVEKFDYQSNSAIAYQENTSTKSRQWTWRLLFLSLSIFIAGIVIAFSTFCIYCDNTGWQWLAQFLIFGGFSGAIFSTIRLSIQFFNRR